MVANSLCMMCLGFDEIIKSGEPSIREIERLSKMYPDPNQPGAYEAFSRQVRQVENAIVHTYSLAAVVTRKTSNLSEIVEVWRLMGQLCQFALRVLAELKNKYPNCGAPELYDRVLDYKLACDKRFKGASEELACQTTDLPKNLFPCVS